MEKKNKYTKMMKLMCSSIPAVLLAFIFSLSALCEAARRAFIEPPKGTSIACQKENLQKTRTN